MWTENIKQAMLFYLVLFNVIGFTVVVADKYRAKRHKWRIRESRFFLIALLGGGVGVYSGMRIFHHKTKHRYFMWGIPSIVIIQCILAYFIYCYW